MTRPAIGIALCFLASGCGKNGPEPSLRDRIVAAATAQYCHPPDACFNPHVLAVETGYDVTTFLGASPRHAHLPAGELERYLRSLPMQAWPRGPSIAISPTDDVTDGHAVEQNSKAAQQLCREMGLEVQVLMGG